MNHSSSACRHKTRAHHPAFMLARAWPTHLDHFELCGGVQHGAHAVALLPQPPLRMRQVGGAVAGGYKVCRLCTVKLRGALQEGHLKILAVHCRRGARRYGAVQSGGVHVEQGGCCGAAQCGVVGQLCRCEWRAEEGSDACSGGGQGLVAVSRHTPASSHPNHPPARPPTAPTHLCAPSPPASASSPAPGSCPQCHPCAPSAARAGAEQSRPGQAGR
jgi:hypothetical protein